MSNPYTKWNAKQHRQEKDNAEHNNSPATRKKTINWVWEFSGLTDEWSVDQNISVHFIFTDGFYVDRPIFIYELHENSITGEIILKLLIHNA